MGRLRAQRPQDQPSRPRAGRATRQESDSLELIPCPALTASPLALSERPGTTRSTGNRPGRAREEAKTGGTGLVKPAKTRLMAGARLFRVEVVRQLACRWVGTLRLT